MEFKYFPTLFLLQKHPQPSFRLKYPFNVTKADVSHLLYHTSIALSTIIKMVITTNIY